MKRTKRKFSTETKASILAELASSSLTEVAKAHDISTGTLSNWKTQAFAGAKKVLSAPAKGLTMEDAIQVLQMKVDVYKEMIATLKGMRLSL